MAITITEFNGEFKNSLPMHCNINGIPYLLQEWFVRGVLFAFFFFLSAEALFQEAAVEGRLP